MDARRDLEESIRHYKETFGLAESVTLYELRNQAYAMDCGWANLADLEQWRNAKLAPSTLEWALCNNWLATQSHAE